MEESAVKPFSECNRSPIGVRSESEGCDRSPKGCDRSSKGCDQSPKGCDCSPKGCDRSPSRIYRSPLVIWNPPRTMVCQSWLGFGLEPTSCSHLQKLGEYVPILKPLICLQRYYREAKKSRKYRAGIILL